MGKIFIRLNFFPLLIEFEDQDYLLPLKVNPETETVHKNSKDKLKKDV